MNGSRQAQSQDISGSCKQLNMKVTATGLWTNRGACKHSQCHFLKFFSFYIFFPKSSDSTRPRKSTREKTRRLRHSCLFHLIHLSPSDCLCIYLFIFFESVQFCEVCVWGPGHSNTAAKSIALIKGITSQKEKKNKK